MGKPANAGHPDWPSSRDDHRAGCGSPRDGKREGHSQQVCRQMVACFFALLKIAVVLLMHPTAHTPDAAAL